MSITDYLAESLFGEDTTPEPEGEPEPQGEPEPIDPVTAEIMDALDRKFKAIDKPVEAKKILDATVDSFDRLMNDLIGKFIPPVHRTVANE